MPTITIPKPVLIAMFDKAASRREPGRKRPAYLEIYAAARCAGNALVCDAMIEIGKNEIVDAEILAQGPQPAARLAA